MIFAVVCVVAFFVLLFAVPICLAMRHKGSSLSGPQDREIDYDNPYRGTAFWTNKHLR